MPLEIRLMRGHLYSIEVGEAPPPPCRARSKAVDWSRCRFFIMADYNAKDGALRRCIFVQAEVPHLGRQDMTCPHAECWTWAAEMADALGAPATLPLAVVEGIATDDPWFPYTTERRPRPLSWADEVQPRLVAAAAAGGANEASA